MTESRGTGFCLVTFLCIGGATGAGIIGALPSGEAAGVAVVAVSLLLGIANFAVAVAKAGEKKPEPPEAPELPPRIRVFPKITAALEGRVRCPYCHVRFEHDPRSHRSCPGCKAIYHDDCLLESEGCTTLGCVHLGPRRPSLRV